MALSPCLWYPFLPLPLNSYEGTVMLSATINIISLSTKVPLRNIIPLHGLVPGADHDRPCPGGCSMDISMVSAFQRNFVPFRLNSMLLGTPASLARPPQDISIFIPDVRHSSLRKAPGQDAVRKRIQELATTVDPGVKIDSEAETASPSTHLLLMSYVVTYKCCPSSAASRGGR